jgi:uncharacterized metal-binding protein
VLEQAQVPLRGYLVITSLGIGKNKDLNLIREEIDRVKQAVKDLQRNQGQTEGCCG